jgi:NAD-dependent dihydropyrimidine dehydrogenase PreA subunit
MERKQDSCILFCHCAFANSLPGGVKTEVLQALKESGLSFIDVRDLCELAARKSPLLSELVEAARLTVAACHPRAIKWLFEAGGAPLRDGSIEFLDMREASADPILCSIRKLASGGNHAGRPEENSIGSPNGADSEAGVPDWKPWFPVIDYERCRNCQQCLGFCLFGVYAADAGGKVYVKNPASCKTDCPACARVCPETAIIFPKYPQAPINGGELKEGESPAEPVKVNMTALAGTDIFKSLRDRGKSGARFAPDPARLKAVQERLLRLTEAQRPMSIPLDSPALRPPAKKEPE